ncbi:MAG: phosphoenolpyruvate--protein phosphotransferase [Phycisphaerales bacterium]|nr:phosphoenolpyruvate--protein phosphotransferase [Phycisphaerales bacterium]
MVLPGIPVSSGIVIGRVFVLDHDAHRIARWTVTPEQVEPEVSRFDTAVASSLADLDRVYEEAKVELGPEASKIFLFHKGMLSDPSLIKPIREMLRSERVNAEHAVAIAFEQIAQAFMRQRDSAFRTKTDDIRDLAHRVLGHLMGSGPAGHGQLEHPAVVIASDLTPSQTAGFDRSKVVGFVTDLGGRTSHTSIVANALGLPAVVGTRSATSACRPGQEVIVDGDRGLVVFDPDEDELEKYRAFIEQRRVYQLSLAELADLPSITRDGTHIRILGNIEFPEESATILSQGGEGVGLYRTEFLYLAGDRQPTEDDHFEAYRRCIELLRGRPLTIRTLDLGADKYTQARAAVPERNPALGLRSIRYSLAEKTMFRRQLRAILRASGGTGEGHVPAGHQHRRAAARQAGASGRHGGPLGGGGPVRSGGGRGHHGGGSLGRPDRRFAVRGGRFLLDRDQ